MPSGIYKRKSAKERFDEKWELDAASGCWLWTGPPDRMGYGRFNFERINRTAYSVAYELYKGPVPEGLHIDHLCHTLAEYCVSGPGCLHRRCVNPEHLEAVTQNENAKRSHPGKRAHKDPMCGAGHVWDEGNTYVYPATGKRACRACRRVYDRKRAPYRRRKEEGS